MNFISFKMAKNKRSTGEKKIVTLAIQEGIREITQKNPSVPPEVLLRNIDAKRLNAVIDGAYQFVERRPHNYSGKKAVMYLYNTIENAVVSGSVFYEGPRSLSARTKTMRIAASIFAGLGVLFILFFGINMSGNVISSEVSSGEGLFGIGFGIFLLILSFVTFLNVKKVLEN